MSAAKQITQSIFDVEELKIHHFNFIAERIFLLAGIHLDYNEKNVSLIQNRVMKIMRKYNLSTYDNLMTFLKDKVGNVEVTNEFISALTTNKTDFFREEIHFDILLKEVKHALTTRTEVYIWSAACSIGAEPYTMAIHLKENLAPAEYERVRILATDIDVACLKTATEGFYAENQMSGLTDNIKNKYFSELAGTYEVDSTLKSKIHFSQLNLFNYPFPISKKFDIIFCRNVLIYFTAADREKVCSNLASYLQPEGTLVLGLSETGCIKPGQLKLTSNSTYKKVQK